MLKKKLGLVLLLLITLLRAEYDLCEDNQQAKDYFNGKGKKGFVLAGFIAANDTASFNFHKKVYMSISNKLEKNKKKLPLALVKYSKDEELEDRFRIESLPHTVILNNGIPIKATFGILPEDALWDLITFTLGED